MERKGKERKGGALVSKAVSAAAAAAFSCEQVVVFTDDFILSYPIRFYDGYDDHYDGDDDGYEQHVIALIVLSTRKSFRKCFILSLLYHYHCQPR